VSSSLLGAGELGANSLIHNYYTYFDWTTQNGQGRLSNILSQKNTTDLQNLSYTYDPMGNVLTIKDYLDMTGQNPQTQTFIYDSLDRLTSAQAQYGTNGIYALQYYTYNPSTGNLSSKAGVNYTYGDTNHDHAVTQMGSDTYTYDANGNQAQRVVSGSTYNLTYDAENHLVGVSGAVTASFVYDGDGNRVKGTISTTTTAYVGNYFEWTGSTSTMKKYYYAGATRVAMRTGSSTLNFLLGDHLGSNAITTNSSGVKNSEIRYMPWGTTRYTSGSSPTTFQFTGQRLESSFELYYYGARWYDPAASRFVQPDTVIPQQQGVQAWDRYAYANNNPVKYTDSSGQGVDCGAGDSQQCWRQVMIEQVIYAYNVDTSYIEGNPTYNPDLEWNSRFNSNTRTVEVGPSAFSSPGRVASTIGHENIHGEQLMEGRLYDTDQGFIMNEVEAWSWEQDQYIYNNNPFDLSETEYNQIIGSRNTYYDVLSNENQEIVSNGSYIIPNEPIIEYKVAKKNL
jgi:RHS repeat-associated protein